MLLSSKELQAKSLWQWKGIIFQFHEQMKKGKSSEQELLNKRCQNNHALIEQQFMHQIPCQVATPSPASQLSVLMQ